MDIDKAADYYEPEVIAAIKRVVAVKSCEGAPSEGMPFGAGPAAALRETLAVAEELGFEKTVNLDNYAGYVEMGSGDEVIGILGHVDVVPEGEGWHHDPYGCEEADGWIYGRGVTDDKGPLLTALFAMKIIADSGIKLNKRIRLVIGTNEETGFGGMKYYREHEGGFTCGFTPDADFPLIFGEKGNYNGYFSGSLAASGAVKILAVNGGEAKNIVAYKCTAMLGFDGSGDNIQAKLAEFAADNGASAEYLPAVGGAKITITGRPAHASTPELGLNAISLMMKFLAEITEGCAFVNGYNKAVGMDCDGSGCGVKYADEYGALTFNVGMISSNADNANATIDIRYPLTTADFKPYAEKISAALAAAGLVLDGYTIGKPLFVDPQSDLVKSLYSAYSEVTGDSVNKPFTIGGGTYAKAFDNITAFGCEFPGSGPYNIHAADERMSIAEMKKSLKIFVKAIINLLEI